MKKIILSVAVATMALSTAAAALDNIKADGQAVLYYETHKSNGAGDKGYMDHDNTNAVAGIQFNLGADLGNNFTFGSQMTTTNALGLGNEVANGAKQTAGIAGAGATTADIALTKVYVAKKVGNTTVKMGRQELPKSLSPLAFSEGWNVYKNTFDAILAVNTDLPKTTMVGAYVSGATGMGLNATGNLTAVTTAGTLGVAGGAYMLTAATKIIPMVDATLTYYAMKDVSGVPGVGVLAATTPGIGTDAYWADVKVNNLPLNLSVQAGKISPDGAGWDDTKAFGVKASKKIGDITLTGIYTDVSAPDTGSNGVAVRNVGTGIKSPLYSQMMYNQNMIALDSDTVVLKAGYDMGDMGAISVNYGMTSMGNRNGQVAGGTLGDTDYNELDLVYKVKSGGVQYFAIAAIRDIDATGQFNYNNLTSSGQDTTATKDTVVRFWARYNF